MTSIDYLKVAGGKFICGFDGYEMDAHLQKLINDYNVAGIILFTRNIKDYNQVKTLVNKIKEEAEKAGYEDDILIAIDQENGLVNRLSQMNFYMPGAMSLGASNDSEMSYEVGYRTAYLLNDIGVNINLAPVLDLNTNPNNPGLGTRSFSDNPTISYKNACSFIDAHKDNGILNTIKHFPGLGDLSVDTHLELPEINKTYDELLNLELIPFKEALKKENVSLMTAHIRYPKIDRSKLPGTMSKKIISGLIRDKLGFDGVVITDCLEMHAISKNYGVGQGALKAFVAGADIAIVSHHLDAQEEAIKTVAYAIENGEIDREIIEKSRKRISHYKSQINMGKASKKTYGYSIPDLYKKSVTVLKNDKELTEKALFLVPFDERRSVGEDDKDNRQQFFKELVEEKFENPTIFEYNNDNFNLKLCDAMSEYEEYDIVIGTLNNNFYNLEIKGNNNIHVVALRDPYPNKILYKSSQSWIDTYDLCYETIDIALDTLLGNLSPTGKLPIKEHFR